MLDVMCDTEHLKPVNVKIAQLREALAAVSAEQIYLKARDLRHRISKSLLIKYPNCCYLNSTMHSHRCFKKAPFI